MYFPIRNVTRHIGVSGFTPPILNGLLMQIDVNANNSIWTDTARTTAATVSGSTVQGVTDLSGNGNHWAQSSAAISPKLAISPTNGKQVLRFPNDGTAYMTFVSRMTTIRTVYWVVMQAANWNGGDWTCFLLGDSSFYNFHANQTGAGCFSTLYSTVNLLHIDKTNVAINTARPSTLKVVTAQTNAASNSNQFSFDRGEVPARSWQGDLALLLVYSDVHTAGQMSTTEDAIKNYLNI